MTEKDILFNDILKNPEDLGLQKIYHDLCLDQEIDSKKEYEWLLSANKKIFEWNDNGFMINTLTVHSLPNFQCILPELVKYFPFIKIYTSRKPSFYQNFYYWTGAWRALYSRSTKPYATVASSIDDVYYSLLQNYDNINEYGLKQYFNENKAVKALEDVLLEDFIMHRDICLNQKT